MIVYIIGVFDLFHIGHLNHILNAKKQNANISKLIVGVCSDKVVISTKRKPIIPENQRIMILQHIKGVDEVIVYNNLNQIELLKKMNVDVFCIGPEYIANPYYDEMMSFCNDNNIDVQIIERTKNISTTDIIKNCINRISELENTAHNFWNSSINYPSYNAPIEKRREYEVDYLLKHLNSTKTLLDLACGDGSLVKILQIKTNIEHFFCYDFSETLLDNITCSDSITKCNYDVITSNTELPVSDATICAGLLPFIFKDQDILNLLSKIKSDILLIRAPCSIDGDNILVDGFSQDLNRNYSSLYRTVENVSKLLSRYFKVNSVSRIYPDELESKYGTKQFYFHCSK